MIRPCECHGLAHLLRRVIKPHDAGSCRRSLYFWNDEHVTAEQLVEAPSDIARQLDVLTLVIPHWDQVGPVQEYVRRHEHWISQQAAADSRPPARLSLELRHPFQPTQRGHAVQEPHEFGVLRYIRL